MLQVISETNGNGEEVSKEPRIEIPKLTVRKALELLPEDFRAKYGLLVLNLNWLQKQLDAHPLVLEFTKIREELRDMEIEASRILDTKVSQR